MPGHRHAVVRIDAPQARVLNVNVEETDEIVIRPRHIVRAIGHGEKRAGHRVDVDRVRRFVKAPTACGP